VGVGGRVVLGAGSGRLGMCVDWVGFGAVGFRSVFSTVLVTRLVQFLVVGLVVGGLLACNIVVAYRTRPVFVPVVVPADPMARYRTASVGHLRLVGLCVPVLVGVIAGLSGAIPCGTDPTVGTVPSPASSAPSMYGPKRLVFAEWPPRRRATAFAAHTE